jgi:Branched-chain amino acid transport protein (AzlD)
MSWALLVALGAGCYALKALGPVLTGGRRSGRPAGELLGLLAVPLLAALLAVQTLDGGRRLVVDARLAGLGVAAVLVWRRAPFLVVVVAAAATAALVRAL